MPDLTSDFGGFAPTRYRQVVLLLPSLSHEKLPTKHEVGGCYAENAEILKHNYQIRIWDRDHRIRR